MDARADRGGRAPAGRGSRRAALGFAAALCAGCAAEPEPPRTWEVLPPPPAGAERTHLPYRADAPALYLPLARGAPDDRIRNRAHVLYDRQAELVLLTADSVEAGHRNESAGEVITSSGVARTDELLAQGGRVGQVGRGARVRQQAAEERVAQDTAADTTAHAADVTQADQVAEAEAQAQDAQARARGQEARAEAAGQASGQARQVQRGEVRQEEATGRRAIAVARVAREARAAESRAYLRARAGALAAIVETDRVLQHLFDEDQVTFRKRLYRELTPLPQVITADLEAFDAAGAPLAAIVPGETFEYRITVTNHTHAQVRNLFVYDEFPLGLRFEHHSERASVQRASGRRQLASSPFLTFSTPNEWEEGKLLWALAEPLDPGEALALSFSATYYEAEGVAGLVDGQAPRVVTDAGEEVELTPGRDTVLVAVLRSADEAVLRVSVRRPGGARVDGLLPAAAFDPRTDEDATDRERRLLATIYAGWDREVAEAPR